MKKIVFAVAILGASAGFAQAQTNVTIYGIVDAAVRYDTNETATGGHKLQMGGGGPLSGSRIGFKGTEDLGGGLSAIFSLENGFTTGTGAAQQGGLLFGREALVGLKGDFGKLTLGRQYAVVHDMIVSYDAYYLSNAAMIGFQGGNYTMGSRLNNSVRYAGTFGGVTGTLGYSLGEVAGSTKTNSSTGASLAYDNGPLHLGTAWQVLNNETTQYYGLTTTPVSQQKTWTVGGTYIAGPAKLYLNYINTRLDVADYKNNSYSAGVNYAISGPWSLISMVYYDKLTHAGNNGTRLTIAPTLDYRISKRTDVYLTVDYTRLTDAWKTLASQPGFQTPFFGHDTRTSVTTGLRHTF